MLAPPGWSECCGRGATMKVACAEIMIICTVGEKFGG